MSPFLNSHFLLGSLSFSDSSLVLIGYFFYTFSLPYVLLYCNLISFLGDYTMLFEGKNSVFFVWVFNAKHSILWGSYPNVEYFMPYVNVTMKCKLKKTVQWLLEFTIPFRLYSFQAKDVVILFQYFFSKNLPSLRLLWQSPLGHCARAQL